jgi:hypothetical protein
MINSKNKKYFSIKIKLQVLLQKNTKAHVVDFL